MERKIFHGILSPNDFSRPLEGQFHRGNYRVQQFGDDERRIVQIATTQRASSGGQTALTVTIQRVEDGIMVEIGEQSWLGIAASIGISLFSLVRNPLNILGRIDDIAQDIEHIQLREEIWKVIESTARTIGAKRQLSERLQSISCEYCATANPVGQSNCLACGAPLGTVQPGACWKCGYVILKKETTCPNCQAKII